MEKNLAKTKYLLYELIIKMLLQLRKGKDVDSKVRFLLEAVEFQYNKSLYDQAFISLQKAKKLVAFFEHYGYWLEVLNWQMKLYDYSPKMREEYSLKSILKEAKKVKYLFHFEMDLAQLLQGVQLLAESSYESPMSNFMLELEVLCKNRLITKYKAKTFLAKLYTLEIHTHEALAIKKYDQAFVHLDELHDLWNDQKEKIAMFPHDFIRFCTLYMNSSASLELKGKHFYELHSQLLALEKVSGVDERKVFFLCCLHDFNFNLIKDNLEFCSVQIFTIKELINQHVHKLGFKDKANLYFHIGIFLFYEKGVSRSFELDEKNGKTRYPWRITCFAKPLQDDKFDFRF